MNIKAGLARYEQLKDEANRNDTARQRMMCEAAQVAVDHYTIIEEARALLFNLHLHMSCRRFFKYFNIV